VPDRFVGQLVGGRYQLASLIGTGAYAWVFEATDTELRIPVAVKVLRPEHGGGSDAETRFRREATTAARLRHPNVVTIRDVGHGDGTTWVVMDLLPGSLARRLSLVGALPEHEAVRIGLDVAGALAAAHRAGIIHRDIKPDNILLAASGEAVVCDFGLARALTGGADLSATNQVVGTPHYFSPEQARGEPLDGRSDLYALGVTLYRAATGRLPFDGSDWYAVARQHIDVPPPDPRSIAPHLTPPFAALLASLLAKAPGDRPASAGELMDALAALSTAPPGRATGSAPPASARPALPAVPPRRTRRLAGVATFLAVLAALLWLARGTPRPDTIWARLTATEPPPAATTPVARPDSGPAAGDVGPSAPDTPRVGAAGRDADQRRGGPPPRAATLTVRAPADAEVRLDGRRLAGGPQPTERLAAGAHVLVGRLTGGDGVDGCPSAARADTLVLSAGESRVHLLELARCTRLVVGITPADARVSLTNAAGDTVAPAPGVPATLRSGVWTVRAAAPRCASYDAVDTFRVGPDTMRIVMLCR
jgi:hypothetical protein